MKLMRTQITEDNIVKENSNNIFVDGENVQQTLKNTDKKTADAHKLDVGKFGKGF